MRLSRRLFLLLLLPLRKTINSKQSGLELFT
jgi:hypothetical protein